ncbi:MAG: lipopolysaccharide biosynthesis protein [Prevotella sp.]|nr:lipopolysaccharide biosynthesis protein [Prevotella sp.]
MSSTSTNSRRIAKNTLLLYFRMLFLMFISLYTSRVILNALGVTDYGIYNVVGGVVTMFSLLSGSLNAAISRFITYELGTGNSAKLKKIFSSAVTIQGGLALIIILIAETVGLWFLNYKMVIPDDRMLAANWCFQFSIITFAINLISVPYNAAIVAHERMSAFAYISILEAAGKLIVAWCIVLNPIDRLIFYAAMVAVIAWVIRMVYVSYCKKQFEECTYHFIFDKMLLKQMFGFAGWNFIGASSHVLRTQGINILLNLFFGPSVNAARAIAVRVNASITGFVHNFMVALNPQITKSYASGDKEYMFKLMYQGARLSFYILLLLGLPILINTHYVLVAWLKLVPEHTVLFVQLTLIFAMSESISNPLITAMLATGKIRNYQIIVGGLQMLNLPIAYVCLYLGAMPESVVIVAIALSQCCLAARLIMLHNMIGLKITYYIRRVYFNAITVTVLSAILPILYVKYSSEGFWTFVIASFLSIVCTVLVEMYVGCTKKERQLVYSHLSKIIGKIRER